MSVTNTSDPMIGQVLDGRYEIVARLARGGMATVYRAVDRRLSRAVAVKVMHEGLGDDADFTKKFDREARSAAALSHPNVVSVFDQGHDRGRPYIVMEYVEGRTLRTVISAEAPLDPLRALQFMEPIARALAAAHEAGLVHRDVKPENVLLSTRGQAKVADFGLARAMTGQTATATQGLLIGTVSYLPPELVTNGRATSRSDVYSAGVVLFEMLTGRKPHVGETPIQVAYSHVHHDVPSPSSVLAGELPSARWRIPPYIDALVRACTSRDPLARPADGRALLERVTAAREALARGVTDDPRLTEELGAPGESEAALPAAATPAPRAGSATAQEAEADENATTRTIAPVIPVSPAVNDPVPDPVAHTEVLSPAAPAPIDYTTSYGAARYDTTRVPLPANQAGVRVSTTRVHRRRRGLVALLAVLVLALIAGGGGWWAYAGRYQAAPSLLNLTEAEARAITDKAKLTLRVQQEFSDDIPAGLVDRADPPAGARVLRQGTITVWLSKGPELFAIPKVIGLTLEAATAAITGANLSIGTVTPTYDDVVPPGVVLSNSPKAGDQVKRGTQVSLTVSQGPQPIAITDYTGKKTEDAQKALAKAGFTVKVTTENSKTVAAGLVISQSPTTGNGKKGDTINLVSSLGPVMVTIPNLRFKSVADATNALQELGFVVKVNYLVPKNIGLGLVSYSSPAAGTKVPQGSTVTLNVA